VQNLGTSKTSENDIIHAAAPQNHFNELFKQHSPRQVNKSGYILS
jgi:hypothetical protein